MSALCYIELCKSYHNGTGICNAHANAGKSGKLTDAQIAEHAAKILKDQVDQATAKAAVYTAAAEALEKGLLTAGGSGIVAETSLGAFHICTHGVDGEGSIGLNGTYIDAENDTFVCNLVHSLRAKYPCPCCK